MSRYDYPDDEFDTQGEVPVPVGVHRAPLPAWRSWAPLLAVIVIVPLLAWGVVAFLGRGSQGSSTAQETSPPAEASQAPAPSTPEATQDAPVVSAAPTEEETTETLAPTEQSADLTLGVTLHNGTAVNGLAGRTGERLTNAGFTAVDVVSGSYDMAEPSVSTIFYDSPDSRATAEKVGETLGVTNIVESPGEAQSNPIVVVLRSDFQE